MSKKRVIVLSIAAIFLIVIPYVWMFADNGLSSNTADWGNFAMYISGLLIPFFTILNLIILTNVNSSIKDLSEKRQKHDKKIEKQMHEGLMSEFRVGVETQKSLDESFRALDEHVRSVYCVLDTLANDVGDKEFKITCLATPNVKARLNLQIAQLKVNVYQELCQAANNSTYQRKWEKAMDDMEKLHKNTYLAD